MSSSRGVRRHTSEPPPSSSSRKSISEGVHRSGLLLFNGDNDNNEGNDEFEEDENSHKGRSPFRNNYLRSVSVNETYPPSISERTITTRRPPLSSPLSNFRRKSPEAQYEDILNLRKQLASTKQDLQITKLSKSCSGVPGDMTTSISTTSLVPPGPGSPYRSSGSLNGLASRPSLNKELVQKLRSMTETIKMLSEENAIFREENQRLAAQGRPSSTTMMMTTTTTPLVVDGKYDKLSRNQLIALGISYEEKIAKLTEDLDKLQTELFNQNKANLDNANNKGEKDKYKALARRLKEERNQYKSSLEEKQHEQAVLKDEMDKMSEIISELRDNCHKLQEELSEVRQRKFSSEGVEVAVQTIPQKLSNNSRPVSNPTLSESVRKARSVYGNKQPKPFNKQGSNSSLRDSSTSSQRNTCSTFNNCANSNISNNKPPQVKNIPKASVKPNVVSPIPKSNNHNNANGPRIAKPVSKPKPPSINNKLPITSSSSPAKRKITSRIPMSSSPPRSPGSRIPQPGGGGSSRIPVSTPSPSRIPSMPRYGTPNVRNHREMDTPTPPPPPPPQPEPEPLKPEEEIIDDDRPMSPAQDEYLATPARAVIDDDDEEEEDDDEEVLLVERHEDGKLDIQVEIHPSPQRPNNLNDIPSPKQQQQQQLQQQQQQEQPQIANNSNNKQVSSGAESNGDRSADDEGSRDSSVTSSIPCTPKVSRKKTENPKQTLASRRVHRTWQQFYEELEERRESNPDLPSPRFSLSSENEDGSKKKELLQRKYSLPTPVSSSSSDSSTSSTTVVNAPSSTVTTLTTTTKPPPTQTQNDDKKMIEEESEMDDAISCIQASILAHAARSKAIIKSGGCRIFTARPWLKNKRQPVTGGGQKTTSSSALDLLESSEEEMEGVCNTIQGVLRGHEARKNALQRLEADAELFTVGKVSAIKAKFNERRNYLRNPERSDGITDDDDDVLM